MSSSSSSPPPPLASWARRTIPSQIPTQITSASTTTTSPILAAQTSLTPAQVLVSLLLGLLLLYLIIPQRVMDWVDAYMELPSFADIPLILRDQVGAFLRRRGLRMPQTPLYTTTTSTSPNDILGDSNRVDDRGEPISLSERLKARGWPTSSLTPRLSKVPGLVNSGNLCFMNSVLQALASIPEFQTYLETINDGPETTPVTNATTDLLHHLNTPHPFSTALHPDTIARTLMQSDKSRLLATREQQDAQEFLMFLLDALDRESHRQWLKSHSPPGLESLPPASSPPGQPIDDMPAPATDTAASPFEGLSAHRMGCLKCKFVENIRLEKFGPMVLPLTTLGRKTTLQQVLHEEFKMEVLDDVECVKCTLLAYRAGLARVVSVLGSTSAGLDATRRLAEIDKALSTGKIGDPKLLVPSSAGGEGDQSIRKFMKRSPKTKHSMIARAPKVLAFHIQRSNYLGRATKNQASVEFPVELDVSEYVTTTRLSMDPEEPISVWREGVDDRTVYQLRSVIVHYGLHHMGHYVAYRRHGDMWYRISDEDVEITSIEEVLSEGARGVFMLMYELIPPPQDSTTQQEQREISLALTLDTIETTSQSVPESTPTSPDDSPTISDDIPAPTAAVTAIPADLDLQLEKVHISPPSSDTSTDDTDQDRKTSRSTSFSSVHSRPATPIFEVKDPMVSPPPAKRLRIEIEGSG